jgi:Xaa-Pro aminopeptidase
MTNIYSERLTRLEQAIAAAQVDLYLVPMVDAFQSEYIHASAARLPYVSGFTGSAGLGIFAAKPSEALAHTLFVDGRYTLQAANEVDTARIRIVNSGEVSVTEWLSALPDAALRIGLDPWLINAAQVEQWQKATRGKPITWVLLNQNLVDGLWQDRPPLPAASVALHPVEYAGKSFAEKRMDMRAAMEKHKADALLLTQPDAVNWLLNIRGGDIPFNPLLLSYLLLTRDGAAVLYTYPRDWSAEVTAYFVAHQVTVVDVAEAVAGRVPALGKGTKLMMDVAATPYGWCMLAEAAGAEILAVDDPAELPKAIKNTVELNGIRAAHLRDGLALVRFLSWFDARTSRSKFPDELEVVATLEQFRARAPEYRGASFATIAGAGAHGAIIHYRADEKSNRRTNMGELFLLDSGGQYPDGTTDVTRTLAVGVPTPAMKAHFTRVLKGHIALARAQFPAGTNGSQLDVLARQYLWEVGLDYDHGTGHGVGAYLSVHEGPQRISKRGGGIALKPGMILSNEPGYYAAGEYGIRIENLVAVVEAKSTAHRPMLAFETLTLVPIDIRLIDATLLTNDEHNWLNQYHRRVQEAHAPHLTSDEKAWLANATRAI